VTPLRLNAEALEKLTHWEKLLKNSIIKPSLPPWFHEHAWRICPKPQWENPAPLTQSS